MNFEERRLVKLQSSKEYRKIIRFRKGLYWRLLRIACANRRKRKLLFEKVDMYVKNKMLERVFRGWYGVASRGSKGRYAMMNVLLMMYAKRVRLAWMVMKRNYVKQRRTENAFGFLSEKYILKLLSGTFGVWRRKFLDSR